jgi:hypothetical protein
LLSKAGFHVVTERVGRPRLPVIMLGDHALALIRDVFDRSDLFADLPRIEKRVVAWGPNSRPLELNHSAVVVSEELLLDSLQPIGILEQHTETLGKWSVLSSQPLPTATIEHGFGLRTASAVPVTLTDRSGSSACCIESLSTGWLFLIPAGPDSCWLLSVGDTPETLLMYSRVIAPRIASYESAAREFPAYPRIISPLCGPGWLACGTAAMAFDPICGDGTANAIREAILASAVIRAATGGEDIAGVLAHYESRLTAGFLRHLFLCRQFYASGWGGSWWDAQLACIEEGIRWCKSNLSDRAGFRYGLRGFELLALP